MRIEKYVWVASLIIAIWLLPDFLIDVIGGLTGGMKVANTFSTLILSGLTILVMLGYEYIARKQKNHLLQWFANLGILISVVYAFSFTIAIFSFNAIWQSLLLGIAVIGSIVAVFLGVEIMKIKKLGKLPVSVGTLHIISGVGGFLTAILAFYVLLAQPGVQSSSEYVLFHLVMIGTFLGVITSAFEAVMFMHVPKRI